MEIVVTILQGILIFSVWFVYSYLKKLPEQVHAKNLKAFELDLNKQLETFKSDLTTDLELLKINESQLHIHKTQEFTNLIEIFILSLSDPDYTNRLNVDPELRKEHHRKMTDLGTKLFLFASDETVKKFVEWRKFSLSESPDPIKLVEMLAELLVLIRKDLGYMHTECTKDDFLHILLKDWNENRATQG
ncbi:hypothetical protein [Bacillus tequilensis]|uniref:Uncharacterized protein n=1 Tax=Bacillus tequilensis TaxID=227866 RepID=A0A6H0WNF2_9BACI|nr:hypothetical protein [Bacillus tequilensis]QIW82061.1 hypothetical protein G4P54_20885 [Bacillus tequilensis]